MLQILQSELWTLLCRLHLLLRNMLKGLAPEVLTKQVTHLQLGGGSMFPI